MTFQKYTEAEYLQAIREAMGLRVWNSQTSRLSGRQWLLVELGTFDQTEWSGYLDQLPGDVRHQLRHAAWSLVTAEVRGWLPGGFTLWLRELTAWEMAKLVARLAAETDVTNEVTGCLWRNFDWLLTLAPKSAHWIECYAQEVQ